MKKTILESVLEQYNPVDSIKSVEPIDCFKGNFQPSLESGKFNDPEIFKSIINSYLRAIELDGSLSLKQGEGEYNNDEYKFRFHIYTGRKRTELSDHSFTFYVLEEELTGIKTEYKIITNFCDSEIEKIFGLYTCEIEGYQSYFTFLSHNQRITFKDYEWDCKHQRMKEKYDDFDDFNYIHDEDWYLSRFETDTIESLIEENLNPE